MAGTPVELEQEITVMLRIIGAAVFGAVVWTTLARADILTDLAVTFGDISSTQSRSAGACWIKTVSDESVPDESVPDESVPDESVPDESVGGWKCYKLNDIQCRTVAKTARTPGRYAPAPESCKTSRPPK